MTKAAACFGVLLGATLLVRAADQITMVTDCTSLSDGTACDDGNACTVGETCRGGVCMPAAPFTEATSSGSPFATGSNPRGIATADWNGDGRLDLALSNYASTNVTVLLGNGSGGFGPASGSPVAVGVGPAAIVAGHVNGDGWPDLIVPNALSNTVTVLLGNGTGGFSQAAGSPVAVGVFPYSVAGGDLNGDGKLDVVTGNYGSSNVTILLGNGNGGFSPAAGSPVAVGTQPVGVAIGDVNGDGRPDLATANTGSNDVSILLGNGAGGFSPASGSPIAVGTTPESVVASDLSGDGRLDLAVANAASNNVTILLGNGAGGFSAAAGSPVAAGTTPTSIAVLDLNADGVADLAVANRNGDNLTILLGKGQGGFAPAGGSPVAVGTTPISVASGDWNADGKVDLATANFGSSNATVLLSGATFASDGTACDSGSACTLTETCWAGRCTAPVTLAQAAGSPVAVGSSPFYLTAGDWNGDGRVDLAATSFGASDVAILLGNGSGGFNPSSASPVAVSTAPSTSATGDLNSDGIADLAVANSANQSVSILLGNGAGGFTQPSGSPISAGPNPWAVAIGDLSGDGKLDLVVTDYAAGDVRVFLGNGAGGFSLASGSPIVVGSGAIAVALGDVNGDGKLDAAVAGYVSDDLTILLGNGSGGMSAAAGSPMVPGNGPRSIAIGDMNADGKLDLAVANFDDDNVAILLGNGNGSFSAAVKSLLAAGSGPISIAAGDWNGDGKLDLVVSNYGLGNVSILVGNGSGGFRGAGPVIGVGPGSSSLAASDVNADGKLDLAVTNTGANNVTILLGATCLTGQCRTPSFVQPAGSPVAAGTNPFSVTVGDWNGDGKLDSAIANQNSNDVTILLGNGSGGSSQAAGSPIAVSQPLALANADLNADGKLDLAVANYGLGNVTILLGNGSGGFSQPSGSPFFSGYGARAIAVGDWNGDGKPDLVVANYFDDAVSFFLGDGVGGFSQASGSPISSPFRPAAVAVGDLDANGKLDVAVTNYGNNDVSIFLGNGSGGFSAASGSPVAVGTGPDAVAVADLNADGKLDLAVGNLLDGSVSILLGSGSGTFTQASGSPIGSVSNPVSVAIGDLNGDGKRDLAIAHSTTSASILLGNGAGGFGQAPGSPFSVGTNPRSIAIAHVNADGRPDVVTANYTSSDVTFLLSRTIIAPNGTSCDDGIACTTSDDCTGGACAGTPVPPPSEVDNGVRIARSGTAGLISWNLAAGATSSAILRGAGSALPVGPGGGDEACLANGIPSNTLQWSDSTNPSAGDSFWYLVRGDNACGSGPYGFQRKNGTPTVPRVSNTCP